MFHHHCWCMVHVCSVYWCTLVLVTIRPLLVILWYATLHIVNFLSGDFTLTSFGHTTTYNNLLFVTFLHHLGLWWSSSGLKNKLYHIQITCLSYVSSMYFSQLSNILKVFFSKRTTLFARLNHILALSLRAVEVKAGHRARRTEGMQGCCH